MQAMVWYLGACPTCGGDMHDDLEDKGWATCLMCARSVRADELHRAPRPVMDRPVAIAAGPGFRREVSPERSGRRAA
jgi:hypothetical protein